MIPIFGIPAGLCARLVSQPRAGTTDGAGHPPRPVRPRRPHDRQAVRDALKHTGIAQLSERALGSLSGGERQPVLLARALAQQPRLLIPDEPTNHLDIRPASNCSISSAPPA
ncbi:MAG: ATP-binding cassette domain-containing protein [Pseudonocardiaceae bacterium]